MLDVRHCPDHQNDRDNRRGIAQVFHRNTEEIERWCGNRNTDHVLQDIRNIRIADRFTHQLLHGRIGGVDRRYLKGRQHIHVIGADQRAGCNDCGERIDVEFFRGGESNHHRQEGKGRPRHKIKNTVGTAAGVHNADGSQEGNNPLQNTAGGKLIKERRKDAGYHVHDAADNTHIRCRNRCIFINLDQFQHLLVRVAHVIANHHLHLSAGLDNGDNAFHSF
ncbi:hypothetical protein SRABI106_00747 [Rahnella aquatilis]|nr:hypothetical protein SRABI106_00747 [Rahnella aquatilis]